MSDEKKSADDSQQLYVTKVLDLSTDKFKKTDHQSKHTFSSILSQNQNSLSSIGSDEQKEPLDLTTSSNRNNRILFEPSIIIQKSQSLKRSQSFEKDSKTEPSSSKVVRFETFTHSQEKLQKLPKAANQYCEYFENEQKTPSEHKEQPEEVAGPSTYLENLHLLASCASEEKIFFKQQNVQIIMPVDSMNENSFTLKNICSKSADLIEKSHLTENKFHKIREEICEFVSKSELTNIQHCYILKIAFNSTTGRNKVFEYDFNFDVSNIKSFFHESEKIICFGFSIKKPNLGVFCTFFVPDAVFNHDQFDKYNMEENSYIKKTEEGYIQVTMLIRRPSELNRATKGKNEFLFGIPTKNYKKISFKNYFIGFHNRQAFLFRRCGLMYGQYRFAIQLLDDKNCKNLKDSTYFL